jgi:hypothetical protein
MVPGLYCTAGTVALSYDCISRPPSACLSEQQTWVQQLAALDMRVMLWASEAADWASLHCAALQGLDHSRLMNGIVTLISCCVVGWMTYSLRPRLPPCTFAPGSALQL